MTYGRPTPGIALGRKVLSKRLRIKLGTAITFVAGIAICLSWPVRSARVQRNAVLAIKRAGGVVHYAWRRNAESRAPNGSRDWSDAIVGQLGIDFFSNPVQVYFVTNTGSDADLAEIGHLRRLESLIFAGGRVTNRGLENLKDLRSLRVLVMRVPKVDDAGLIHLKELVQLETLILEDTPITNNAIQHLEGLAKLRSLCLINTKVTYSGVRRIERALPSLRVECTSRHRDLPPMFGSDAILDEEEGPVDVEEQVEKAGIGVSFHAALRHPR